MKKLIILLILTLGVGVSCTPIKDDIMLPEEEVYHILMNADLSQYEAALLEVGDRNLPICTFYFEEEDLWFQVNPSIRWYVMHLIYKDDLIDVYYLWSDKQHQSFTDKLERDGIQEFLLNKIEEKNAIQ